MYSIYCTIQSLLLSVHFLTVVCISSLCTKKVYLPRRTSFVGILFLTVFVDTLLWQTPSQPVLSYHTQPSLSGAPSALQGFPTTNTKRLPGNWPTVRDVPTPSAWWRASWWLFWLCWAPCWYLCSHGGHCHNDWVVLHIKNNINNNNNMIIIWLHK